MPSPTWDASGAGYGAIGGATSALTAPLIRDAIYADSPVLNYSDDRVRLAITFDGASFGLNGFDTVLKETNSLANLAGSTSVSGVIQAAKDGATSTIWQQAAGMVGTGMVSAGVNTAVYGGSFGNALIGNLVGQGAALGANAIGAELPGIGADGADAGTVTANALAHGALGCGAAAATGGDCAGGAIGGTASALAAPLIRDAIYADSPVLNYSDDKIRQAVTVGLATLIGGTAGIALGQDATAAALAAQNESLNNATSGQKKPAIPDDVRKMLEAERRAFGQTRPMQGTAGTEVVGPSPLVLGGARGGSTIQQNKAAGDAYAKQTYQNVLGEMPDAVQEVTVKTSSGVRTRLDIIGTSPSGGVVCVECKASPTAPLTPNQVAAFPEMAETGATVVGKGKPGFPGGTVIPPTSVQIVRPGTKPNTGK